MDEYVKSWRGQSWASDLVTVTLNRAIAGVKMALGHLGKKIRQEVGPVASQCDLCARAEREAGPVGPLADPPVPNCGAWKEGTCATPGPRSFSCCYNCPHWRLWPPVDASANCISTHN